MKSKIKLVSKKSVAIFLAALIIMSVIPITVFAGGQNLGEVSGGQNIKVDVSKHYGHELHTTKVNGKTYPLFCIEYGKKSPSNSYLEARKAGASAKVITAAKWAFAGYYMEHGNSIDWLDMAYCQKKIWEILGNSVKWNFSNSGYEAWCKNAQTNMNSLNTLPSFNNKNVGTFVAGTTNTITDLNGVLKDYPAFTYNKNGVTIVHSSTSNSLTIDIDKTCTSSSFKIDNGMYYKNNTGDDDELLLYYPYGSAKNQKLIYSAYYDPVTFAFDGTVIPLGKLKLLKTSEDGQIANVKFTITGHNFLKTVTTNSEGYIEIEDLVPGEYTITEESFNKYEPQKSKTVTVESNKTATVSFNNVLKKGSLKVIKNSEDKLNEGIKFHLTGTSLSGDNVDEYAVTDSNGIAIFNDVLIGTGYTIEEVDTNVKYIIPDSQTTCVNWNDVTTVEFTNKLKKFKISITKQDSEGETPQGDATLAGAVYGIYNNGTLVDTYTTDEDGKFTTKYYPCGDYWTIKEISPSPGYNLDETTYPIGAEAKNYEVEYNLLSNIVLEDVIKGKIQITKTDSKTGEFLPNAGFRIKNANGEVVAEDYTNENGIVEFNLPYGKYTYEEFDAPDDYIIDTTPKEFEIVENDVLIKVEAINDKIEIIVPNTGDNSNKNILLAISGVCVIGIGFAVYKLIKNKKSDNKKDK